MAGNFEPDSPILFSDAKRELLEFPGEVLRIFANAYSVARSHGQYVRGNFVKEACEEGEFKDMMEIFDFGTGQVQAKRKRIQREREAVQRALGR